LNNASVDFDQNQPTPQHMVSRHFNLTPQWLCPEWEIVPAEILKSVGLQKKGYA